MRPDNVLFEAYQPLKNCPTFVCSFDMNSLNSNLSAGIAVVFLKPLKMMACGQPVLAIAPAKSQIDGQTAAARRELTVGFGADNIAEKPYYPGSYRNAIDLSDGRGVGLGKLVQMILQKMYSGARFMARFEKGMTEGHTSDGNPY